MQARASGMLEMDLSLKRVRDELKPLREQLLSEMLANDTQILPIADGVNLRLVQKKARKAVTVKAVYAAIGKKFGATASEDIKAEMEAARGEPKAKFSLKFETAQ